jgi:hypothetical protein
MSRNGNGVYTLPAGNPVVPGTVIATTWANNTMNDLASAMTDSVAADGQTPMTGPLNMNSNKVTNLATGTISGDGVNYAQFNTPTFGGAVVCSSTLAVTGATTLSGAAVANTFSSSGATITGGAIDGTTIGTTTRSTVKATTLDLGLSTQSVAIGQGDSSSIKNRIINGAMVISQYNGTSSVTPTTNEYTLDRWRSLASPGSKYSVQQNAGSVTPPVGFTNYFGVTSLSAYSVSASDYQGFVQKIEGYNVADLGWGTANAKTITLSFWVRSSLTGTFGGSLFNAAHDRSYPYSYTISAADTWEQKSITITGDTTGTWLTDNSVGIQVNFGLGAGSTLSGTAGAWAGSQFFSATGATSVVGTSGATFYITGVQLEVGSQATGFEYRQYGTELQLCQRYYTKSYETGTAPATSTKLGMCSVGVYAGGIFTWQLSVPFITQMRSAPTVSLWDGDGNANRSSSLGNSTTTFTDNVNVSGAAFNISGSGFMYNYNASTTATYYTHYAASAEL